MEWGKYFYQFFIGKDGILYLAQKDGITSKFSSETQNNLFEIEDTSWWFQYRADVICHIARKYLRSDKLTFDVGGGNGYTAKKMEEFDEARYAIALIEPSSAACQNAKKRGLQKIICGTMNQETTIDNSVDQILLLDVLEHIEDDMAFLQTFYQKLVPGGKILLTVPAFQQLWSSEDNEAGHYRRYRLSQLESVAKKTGFEVLYSNYYFEFLFLPIFIVRVGFEKLGLLKRVENRSAEEKHRIRENQFKQRAGIVKLVLNKLEKVELNRLTTGKKIKFGSSIICVLEKDK